MKDLISNKVIYIAGPIKGIENGNEYLFEKAENYYRKLGFSVLNPHVIKDMYFEKNQKPTEKEIMGVDLFFLSQADHVAVLPGWEKSTFAPYEVALAKKFGMQIIKAFSMELIKIESLLIVELLQKIDSMIILLPSTNL